MRDQTGTLIERAKKLEPEAWRELLHLYGPLVDWWIARSDLSEQDCDDIFQNIFLTVARKIQDFDTKSVGSFRGWLRVITRSRVVDFIRRKSRNWDAKGGDQAMRELMEIPEADDVDSPRQPEASAELQQLLAPALAIVQQSVNDRTWEAFWSVTVDQRPTVDVADELGVTPSAVRLAKSRVLKRLRELLEE